MADLIKKRDVTEWKSDKQQIENSKMKAEIYHRGEKIAEVIGCFITFPSFKPNIYSTIRIIKRINLHTTIHHRIKLNCFNLHVGLIELDYSYWYNICYLKLVGSSFKNSERPMKLTSNYFCP